MSRRITNTTLSAAIVAVLYAGAIQAQQPAPAKTSTELETVVVTGSLIKGTPEDTALPVEVFTAEDLKQQGDPSALEFVKSLTASGPTNGEAYYFGGSNLTNNVGFNLRGIGADKTLTLFNGKRAFQNTSVYPSSVIERIEVLKDGAAVTYGADATGGVVNMITRSNYRGFDLNASYKTYQGSDMGEWKVSAVTGFGGDNGNVLLAAEWDHRSELHSYEREFASRPYAENPAPWSTLTNLAGWIPRTALPATVTLAPAATPDVGEFGTRLGLASDFTQSSCEAVGGIYASGTSCAYGYIPFYNLVEENDVFRLFGQVTASIDDDTEFYMRALFARNYSPHQYGSPSQPVVRGPAQSQGLTYQLYVPSVNPHVAAFAARSGWTASPFFAATRGYTPATYRAFAHGGNDVFAQDDNHSTPNENDTLYWHFTTGLQGKWGTAVNYDFGLTYNQFASTNSQPDILGYRLQEALNGYGGPNCRGVDQNANRFGTQAVGPTGTDTGARPAGCEWYNPFASNFAGQPALGLPNPNYIASAANSKELISWLFDERVAETNNYNVTFDALFSGETPLALPGGNVAWGAGAQWRNEKNRENVPSNFYNGMQPCDWPGQDPQDPVSTGVNFNGCTPDSPGPFFFFGTNVPDMTQQRRYSYFGEVQVPVLDSLNFTVAARHEEFSGDLNATVYKVSGKWQIIDQLAIRGAYGTNYQAPGAAVIPGDITNGVNSYTIAAGQWKGATTVTRTDIEPETAKVYSVGLISQLDWGASQTFQVIVDYFHIQTEKELGLLASANDIANSVFTGPAVGGFASANCAHALISRVTFNGGSCISGVSTANDFANIRTDFGNGPGQLTAGFDLQIDYGFNLAEGKMRLGLSATKVTEFEFTPTILDGFVLKQTEDRLGFLNFATIANAAPEWRANFSVNYNLSEHNIRAVVNYTSGVDDERYINADGSLNNALLRPAGFQRGTATPFDISTFGVFGEDWTSIDLHYLWSPTWATVGLSVTNVTDQDPPASRQEMGYDPRIGSPLGRQFEVSIRKSF